MQYSEEKGMTPTVVQAVIPDATKCKPGNNYVKPKAHKPLPNYPGRLITTGCASYIKALAALTAVELGKVNLP